MDGAALSDPGLAAYLRRPLHPPADEVLAAIEAGPIAPSEALDRSSPDSLLDPAPMAAETGWCVLPDGVGYVAVRTAMPSVSAEMVDWWFDWHPRESLRYRIWHPRAHRANALDPPRTPGARAHWGAVHHPVEDFGTGVVHARIEFVAPSDFGFSTDGLGDPRVAAIVCGYPGDDRLRARHSLMTHVFLNAPDGVVLRSRFWLGAAIRPDLPRALATAAERLANRRLVRRLAMPARTPRALAIHCAEEFANLGSLLPELHSRYA